MPDKPDLSRDLDHDGDIDLADDRRLDLDGDGSIDLADREEMDLDNDQDIDTADQALQEAQRQRVGTAMGFQKSGQIWQRSSDGSTQQGQGNRTNLRS